MTIQEHQIIEGRNIPTRVDLLEFMIEEYGTMPFLECPDCGKTVKSPHPELPDEVHQVRLQNAVNMSECTCGVSVCDCSISL